MINFSDFLLEHCLTEAKNTKKAFLVFGRFNPPTKAHLMLFEKMKDLADKNDATPFIFTSHTQDSKKNPLSYNLKISYLQDIAPVGVKVVTSVARNGVEAIKELAKMGFNDVTLCTGSDRMENYSSWKKYIDDFGIESFNTVSIGKERTAVADDLAGMSASKMRGFVVDGKEEEFMKNSPFSRNVSKKLFKDIKVGLKIK